MVKILGDVNLSTSTDDLTVGGTIELGHASDTTLSRSAAGTLAVEGVDVVTTASTLDASKLSGAVPSAVTGKAKVTYAGTAPTSPNSGDVWIDSSTTTPDVALVDSVSSSSTTAAATANSVKTAYDAAALKSAANTFTVAPQQVTVNSASNKGLIVKAAASQTANLQDWQNSSGTVLASVNNRGMLTSSNIASGRVSITPVANTVTSYAITGLSVQSSQATTATMADFSIMVTPEAKNSNISWWAYEDPTFSGTTLTGFSIYILRSNTTVTQFSWMVIGR
jgi:hypothetical protein